MEIGIWLTWSENRTRNQKQREEDYDLGKMCRQTNEICPNLGWEGGIFISLPSPASMQIRATRAKYL